MMSGETISDSWVYGSGETLMAGELANIFVQVVPGGTTDDLDIRADTSKDGTTWTTSPNYTCSMECSGEALPVKSFVFYEFLHFRIGVKSTGSTDDHTVTIDCLKDGTTLS
jgi:hypothetical protein